MKLRPRCSGKPHSPSLSFSLSLCYTTGPPPPPSGGGTRQGRRWLLLVLLGWSGRKRGGDVGAERDGGGSGVGVRRFQRSRSSGDSHGDSTDDMFSPPTGRPQCSILLISYTRQHLDNRKT
ncbi:hypothetical protein Hdeb2414_s0009g00322811 [Helianthus debilis subsp. tardiflorus]